MKKCQQCGRKMNPVDYILWQEGIIGPVCMKCCRENYRKVAGGK